MASPWALINSHTGRAEGLREGESGPEGPEKSSGRWPRVADGSRVEVAVAMAVSFECAPALPAHRPLHIKDELLFSPPHYTHRSQP